MSELMLWCGYKHTSGTYQAKRYSDWGDITEARQSGFCEQVVQPFHANNREEALKIVKEKTS